MAARMRRLVHELGARVLAPKEDAAAVDYHDSIPRIFRHTVYNTHDLLTHKALRLGQEISCTIP